MIDLKQITAITVLAAVLWPAGGAQAQAPDSALAAAVVEEVSKIPSMVDLLPPVLPSRWEAELYAAFKVAQLPAVADSSRIAWMRLYRSGLRHKADSTIVTVLIQRCGKGSGPLNSYGDETDYIFVSIDGHWRLQRVQQGVHGDGRCEPEQTEEPIPMSRADSVSLATAVARVLAADQVSVPPIQPDAPNDWQKLLLHQLEDLGLPEPQAPLHWIKLLSSRAETYPSRALVSVHASACLGEDRLVLDSHMVVYEFGRTEDGWHHVDTRMELSGVGRCETTGPKPAPRQ